MTNQKKSRADKEKLSRDAAWMFSSGERGGGYYCGALNHHGYGMPGRPSNSLPKMADSYSEIGR